MRRVRHSNDTSSEKDRSGAIADMAGIARGRSDGLSGVNGMADKDGTASNGITEHNRRDRVGLRGMDGFVTDQALTLGASEFRRFWLQEQRKVCTQSEMPRRTGTAYIPRINRAITH